MKTTQNDFQGYLQTLYHYTKKQLPIGFGLLLAAGITEGIGLMLLIPLLASLGLADNATDSNPVAAAIHNVFSYLGISSELFFLLGVFLLLIAGRAILVYWRDNYLLKIQLEFVDKLRIHLHEAFGKARWPFLMQQRSSDFSHILTNDISRIGFGTQLFLQAVVSLSLISAYLLTSLYLSPYLTLLVILAGSLLMWLLRGYRSRALVLGKEQTLTGKEVFASVNEFLDGIKLIKSNNAEPYYLDYFTKTTSSQRQKILRFKHHQSFAQQSFQVGSAVLLCLFFYVAIELFDMAVSELFVLTIIFVRLMPLLSNLQRNYEQIMHMLPAYSTAMQFKYDCEQAAETPTQLTQSFTLKQQIALQDVSFSYKSESTVLEQININIPANKTTAIMGESGAGKSTLADLLAGLMLPNNGQIVIDNTPLTEQNLLTWRNQVAYVPQETFLFHDTLKANMLWINPTADDDKLWEVLELAAARSFVEKLPQGLETVIGEKGIRLSGGERQRIALARALLRKPALLILDEATSALDNANEEKIRDALNRLHGSTTIILIAHRLTTVASADQIITIKDKKTVMETS